MEYFSLSSLVVSVFRELFQLFLDINVIRVTINPTFIIIISFHARYLTCEGSTVQYLFSYLFINLFIYSVTGLVLLLGKFYFVIKYFVLTFH